MKTMSCKELGGACDQNFSANTFEELAQLSQIHGKEMFQKGDPAHMKAMQKMMGIMQDPKGMQAWMDDRKAAFDALPNT